MTLQLFEYLLASQSSNLSVNLNLNRYPAYWFLDEIMSFEHMTLERTVGKGISLQLQKPIFNMQQIEISAALTAILNRLQQTNLTDDQIPISTVELKKTLDFEVEALVNKFGDPSQETIIINDWQQILLGVEQSRILLTENIRNEEDLEITASDLVEEYQDWQDALKEEEMAYAEFLKEEAFYENILKIYKPTEVNKKMNLGVGLLHIPGKTSVYHPLLTLEIEVSIDETTGLCEFIFETSTLMVDVILEHVLFYEVETARGLRQEIDQMYIDPFEEGVIATALKKIIKQIHPEGNYFSSPVDALLAPEDMPQILHRSVLFLREEQIFNGESKLNFIVDHLLNNQLPSNVIGSIVDPNFIAKNKHQSKTSEDNLLESTSLWPAKGPEQEILTHLNKHHAVAVLEQNKTDKMTVVANLITYSVATGKRVLIMGENEEELDDIRHALPSFLNGLYHKIPAKKANYKDLKEALEQLREKTENFSISSTEVNKIWEEFDALQDQLNDAIATTIDYSLLSSQKVNWQGKAYQPYELAKMVSELDGQGHLSDDRISLDMTFEVEDSVIEQFWKLRPYFTPENMALLKYDFIDLNELNDHDEYQQMLALEARYLALSEEAGPQLKGMFDEKIDIKFIQYLFDQLPQLMTDVVKIDTVYGNKIMRKALAQPQSHRELTEVLKEVEKEILKIDASEVPVEEKKESIQSLNQMLDVASADLLLLDIQDPKQLVEFYNLRKLEMMQALDVAHLILIFNDGAKALSQTFNGITSDGVEMMDVLYDAAALHLSEVEFEIYWLRVKSHFIRMYQPIIHQPHVHPVCLKLFEALQVDHVNDFKEILEEITELVIKRQAFINFGEFMDQISVVMPAFTAQVMASEVRDDEVAPDFKEAFAKGQLAYFFEQFENYDLETLEQDVERLIVQLSKLQAEMLEIECWRKLELLDAEILRQTIRLLEQERTSPPEINQNLILLSQAVFMPLNENKAIETLDPNLFDVAILIDGSRSNITRISELMHSHKAIIFGNENEKPLNPLRLREDDQLKLVEKFGENLQKFGEDYFGASLFDLMVNSAAWEAQVELPISTSGRILSHVKTENQSVEKEWKTDIHKEIYDTLVKMGYDLTCCVEVENMLFDFVISGGTNDLGLHVFGTAPLSREKIEQQIERERQLRDVGFNHYTISAMAFSLDAHKTMLEVYDRLERLNIYPVKK